MMLGAAYVFHYSFNDSSVDVNSTGYNDRVYIANVHQACKLVPSSNGNNYYYYYYNYFGYSVSVFGDVIAVGAYQEESGSGITG